MAPLPKVVWPYIRPMDVTLGNLTFTPFITQQQIAQRLQTLAAEIRQAYQGTTPIIVPVLNGSFIFAADLIRHLQMDCQVSFIKVASYELMESKGQVEEILGLPDDISGRHVLILEDIVDTGLTMYEVVKSLRELQPASVEIATLLMKPASLKAEVDVRFCGFEIGPEFVVGYGLDYDGAGRHLPEIYVKK